MGKGKLKRFEENDQFSHVIQPLTSEVLNADYPLKGKWKSEYFKSEHPLVLELGCGKGEYTIGMSRAFPDKNFIGIDIKGARLWRGAKTIAEEGIPNAAFIRTRIEFIKSLFGEAEINEIWITFPDPQLKIRRAKKRLTSSGFLENYRQFLHPEGIVHLKTDSKELYDYTLALLQQNRFEILDATDNLYASHSGNPILEIKTHYEELFTKEGKTITYLRFRLNHANPIIEPAGFD